MTRVVFLLWLVGAAGWLAAEAQQVVYLNVAAVHLGRGLSAALSPVYPYVLDADGRAELGQAIRWAERGAAAGDSLHLACLRQRAYLALMDWPAAQAQRASSLEFPQFPGNSGNLGNSRNLGNSGNSETDCPAADQPAATQSALAGLTALEGGDAAGARRFFRQALIEGSGVLSLSLDGWLRQVEPGAAEWTPVNAPRFLTGRLLKYRWTAGPEPASPEWTLVGFDLDETALAMGWLVDGSLYWQPSQAAGGLWREDGRWLNLAPDSGFEWAADGVMVWQESNGVTLSHGSSRVIASERDGRATMVKEILAAAGGRATIIVSPVLPVAGGCLYLAGGWLRTGPAASPAVSVVWAGVADRPEARAFVNLVEGERAADWLHVAGLLRPPAGATGVAIYASNWAAAGANEAAVWVDDLFVLPIAEPGAERPCGFYRE
ncbi:MAG: hypothetical protein AB1791_04445 [Chloroflexota bacterium]